MAKNILSVKLCQLDDCFEKLHRRIDLSQAEDPSKLELEIAALERECVCAEAALMDKLENSKSYFVSALAEGYEQVWNVVKETQSRLEDIAAETPDSEIIADEKTLLAEYVLDFAYRTADRALLIAMEAIDAQTIQQEGEV